MAAGDILSRAVGVADKKPDDDPAGGIFYQLLGTYSIDRSGAKPKMTIASDDIGAQSFELCGGVEPLWGPA